jgi:class 3 adenylate cyclase
MAALSIRDVARLANVDEAFVHRLLEIGAIRQDQGGFGSRDVRRVRLLHSWEMAGLPADLIMRTVEAGGLSLAFLDTPIMVGAEPLERTYRELCTDENVPLSLVQGLHEGLGFAPPAADDRAREDDPQLIAVVRTFMSVGASESGTLRLVRVYADALRRLAQAEADLYESEIEGRLRDAGMDERQLLEFGSNVGERIIALLEAALIAVYRRHREHVWIAHSTNHAEVALDVAGLHPRVSRPPAICFVDLTGYTRITEERGDEVAARFAGELSALVEDISQRRGGRPIRWLGDGGMFHFREPRAAVLAALDMVEGAPKIGLPPTHIGIHTGPVISQDGDVYGRTVNLASRIASYAGAGQVLASEETVDRSRDGGLRFEPVGSVDLKGVGEPVPLYQASRDPSA